MKTNNFSDLKNILQTSDKVKQQISNNKPVSDKYYWKIKDPIDNTEQIIRIENLTNMHIRSIYGFIKRNLHEGHIMGHEREDWLKRLRYEPKRRKIDELRTFNLLSNMFRSTKSTDLSNIFRTIRYDIKQELNNKNYY